MSQKDEEMFLSMIRDRGHLRFINDFYTNESDLIVNVVRPIGPKMEGADLLIADTSGTVLIRSNYHESQRHYCIDKTESETVEFHRCRMAPKQDYLLHGRLWFDENTQRGKKTSDYIKWANDLLKWIRAHYRYDGKSYYIGPDADKLSNEGRLSLGMPESFS